MSRVLRLAILECETPLPKAKAARGSFGDIFQDLFTLGLRNLGDEAANVQLQMSKWDVIAGNYPRIEDVDAIVLTGSYGTAFENDPWIVALVDYVKNTLESTDKKVVGICFGHQIIGRALGADVNHNPAGWELSVEGIALNEQGQRLLGLPSLEVHQMHRDAVLSVPSGATNLGSSTKCPIQILYKPGRVLSFQGHPEFDGPINSEIIVVDHEQSNAFSEEAFQDAIERINRPHDGVHLSSRMMEFFLDSGKWNDREE
ncbi:class I glutamine amidotransferase-like protein [Trichoderma barbatum]